MGDGSFIDEISHSDLFGHEVDGASGFEWADEIISSVEGDDRSGHSQILENSVIHSSHQSTSSNVQYAQPTTVTHLSSQAGTVNVQFVPSSNAVQQAPVQLIQQQHTQLLPNLTNFPQTGLIQGVNGQIFLKPLPNGQFQLATQPHIQQIQQHPQQSSSPIPIQPHPHGSPHVTLVQQPNQSPIPISSPHVASSSSSPHVSRSLTPLQQSRQYGGLTQNVNLLQVQGTGSQPQQQIIRNVPINTQISSFGNFQNQQIIQSQGQIQSSGQVIQGQSHNQGQNFVNTQNTVIQNPNVVNVNVAHVLCSNQFQSQHGQSIQGTLIQTADGKHIIIPSTQLPSSNQIQIQNVPQMAIQPQINVIPTSSNTGTTQLVQGGQVVENSAATLGGLGYIKITTPTSSQQDPKVQQAGTHFIGLNSQGQQILIQRTQTPGQNIVLRQVTPQNVLQIPQQQTPQSAQILPQTGQTTQQILLPQVQRLVTGTGQQQVKVVAPANLQTGNLPMTINIGGQNVILPQNIQQLIQQQQQLQQQQSQQVPKIISSSSENILQNRQSGTSTPSSSSSRSSRSITPQPVNVTVSSSQPANVYSSQDLNANSQVPTFLLSTVSASTANMTPVTTTVSQTKQVISQVTISNSPKMCQTIPSVASNAGSTVSTQKPFLSAVTNAPKLPATTIQLSPQAQQQINTLQVEIRKLQSLKDPTDQQKQQLLQYQEIQKRIITKGQIKLQAIPAQPQIQQPVSIPASNAATSFIGQPALSIPQSGQMIIQQQSSSSNPSISLSPSPVVGSVQSQMSSGLPAQGLVSNEMSFTTTCPTKSIQSQNGSIMSVSPTGNKSVQQQPVIVNQSQSSGIHSQSVIYHQPGQVLVQNQQGSVLVQGQQGSLVVQSQQGPVIIQGQSGTQRIAAQSDTSTAQLGAATVATPTKVLPQAMQGKVPISASAQVAVPTQIKIANHILTLNLTQEQKDKVQGYLAKMTPEQQQQQMALFLKLQHQQKLNAQVQAQLQQHKKLQSQNLQSQIPLPVQQTPIGSASSNIISIESPSKPNIFQRVSVAAIPKHQLIHQQMGKDQANALHTDTDTPFKNPRDTYRRLLRYHVFMTKNPPDDLVKKDDEMFGDLSEGLVRKKNWMFEKYRGLLLEESMREQQTAEIMMIQKLMNEDLKETLEEEKRVAKRNPEEFEAMPRKYLKLETKCSDNPIDVKFDPKTIHIKTEKDVVPTPIIPSAIKKENYDSDGSRPSTPKLKLVIKSDGRGYSSSITEEGTGPNNSINSNNVNSMNFMNSIHVKEEQIEIEDSLHNEPLNDTLKPFESYSKNDDSFNHNSSNDIDDLEDNGADSSSDVTVVSDYENKTECDAIVIDNEESNSDDDNNCMESQGEPVMKHEDISTDFTDFFSKQYQTESSKLSYYPHTSQSNDLTTENVLASFPSSESISNENAYSHNSDAHSTRTIPYSDDGNSLKDEDFSNDMDYNKSTSSFAQYEPISSPEGDQESFSDYLSSYKAFNMGGIRDQGLNFDLTDSNRDDLQDEHATRSSWKEEPTEEEEQNAEKIKAEMESAINSILSLN